MSERKKNMPFWLVGDINFNMIARFKSYLYDCAAEGKDAIVFISSPGGYSSCICDVAETLRVTQVHLTTIGYGPLYYISAAIFCMGEERFLMEGSDFKLYNLGSNITKAYITNTKLTNQIILRNTNNGVNSWSLEDSNYEKYSITTGRYEEIVPTIVALYREANRRVSTPFFFSSEVSMDAIKELMDYAFCCASNNTEAFIEITSSGGNFFGLCGVFETLKIAGIRNTTIGAETVVSSAALMFLMGDRRCLKSGVRLMIHKGKYLEAQKNLSADELKEKCFDLMENDKKYISYCIKKTKIPEEEFWKKTKRGGDWNIKEKDWEKYGIVTDRYEEIAKEIIEKRKSSKNSK